MNIQQILGVGFLVLGLVSLSSYTDELSKIRISWFYKELKPMQDRWGKKAGTILHFISYVVAPIGFGVFFLMGLVAFK